MLARSAAPDRIAADCARGVPAGGRGCLTRGLVMPSGPSDLNIAAGRMHALSLGG
jgi:hypothetical protein